LSSNVDATVIGGHVLTSPRVIDFIRNAFQIYAATYGCGNNLTFGDETLGYYETIGSNTGADPC